MTRILDLVSPQQLARVASLQILARQTVEGYFSGRHRSPQKGVSVEFKEHRPYVRGDELKDVDWKAFAKSDRLSIRQHEQETNLRCTLLVDRSGSMMYGGSRSTQGNKDRYVQGLAASLAYLMLSQQDSVGVITFDHIVRANIPPRNRPSHLQAVLNALCRPIDGSETDLGAAISSIVPNLKRRGLVVLVSDAMGDLKKLGRVLAQIRAQQHEIVFFHILDPDEVDFPFHGHVQFQDLERQTDDIKLDPDLIRRGYLKRFDDHASELRELCTRNRIDLVTIQTDEPLDHALHHYVSNRRIG
ncbi:hypothetical protein Q31b_07610 [Novipirellula aureliae]|uniref:DUF58 domain-containing protein n=1 Tax=Novipirellula aureliae TaxID=2527966 RepID=A0A5C6EDE7_9BACT|nr:DUF58 domain-containing protein [Novipirellula aureliae]TWU45586.1 hypothetical protein Q31b_07610 [Novipirellula aureliae]